MDKLFAALRIRPFLFLWLAEVFSQLAMNMMNFILLLVAFQLTNSSTAVSGIVLSFTIPAVIFGILAGVYVDRWGKRQVLFMTNILRMMLLLILAFLHQNLLMVYTISFLVAIVTQFFIPAETPMIPVIVPKEYLVSANALFSIAWFGSVFVAYALSGSLLSLLGVSQSLFFLSLIFLVGAICVLCIRSKALHTSSIHKKQFNFIKELREAFHTILSVKEVYHAFFILAFSQIFTFVFAVVGPAYARNVLHIDINQFPLFFITPSVIGMAIGAYVMSNFFYRFSRHKIANLGLFLGAITLLLMPHIQGLLSIVVLAVILGMANAFLFVPSQTLVQEHTSEELRGKIYGALNTFASLFALIPVIIVGSLSDIFGVSTVITALGVIIFLIGLARIRL